MLSTREWIHTALYIHYNEVLLSCKKEQTDFFNNMYKFQRYFGEQLKSTCGMTSLM